MIKVITRNCSKLRKIHSGQEPISLMIIPSEFKFFEQFVLLRFKFSGCQFMSTCRYIFSYDKYDTRDLQIWCQGMHKICSDDQKMKLTKLDINHSGNVHYNDVIMSAMASQITGVLIVCINVCSVACRSKKTSKLRVTSLYEGNSPATGQ